MIYVMLYKGYKVGFMFRLIIKPALRLSDKGYLKWFCAASVV